MTKSLAALAWVMLFANVFLPTGVAFAEENVSTLPLQVESHKTEDLIEVSKDGQTPAELSNQEIPSELITNWALVVEESSNTSTLVKYFPLDSDNEVSLLLKADGTVDYEATEAQYSETTDYYLGSMSEIVDFWGEKVIFIKWFAPLFEKKDSIYRQALKTIKNGTPAFSYDLDASLKGAWTSLDSFVKYAEVKKLCWKTNLIFPS